MWPPRTCRSNVHTKDLISLNYEIQSSDKRLDLPGRGYSKFWHKTWYPRTSRSRSKVLTKACKKAILQVLWFSNLKNRHNCCLKPCTIQCKYFYVFVVMLFKSHFLSSCEKCWTSDLVLNLRAGTIRSHWELVWHNMQT